MKLVIDRFVYEPPGLSIIPETDYEAAVLNRYWRSAILGFGHGPQNSADGKSYTIKFVEGKTNSQEKP